MKETYDLFGGMLPHQKHSPTSKAAAIAAEPTAGTLRAEVLAFIRSRHGQGATDEEAQRFLGMKSDTERPRRRELQLKNLVKDSGRTRETMSGRQAVVWCEVVT